MLHRWLLLFTLIAAAQAAAPATAGELLENQVFDRYSPLAAADEFSRRVFSPTTFDRLLRYEQHIGQRPMEQTVDLSKERYDVWVPETRPERGYGLLEFVSPMPRWDLTRDWKKELDLLIGGAKVIGEEDFAPPPAELLTLLQRRMRLVYSTGGNDTPNRVLDARGRREMQRRCVAGVFEVSQRRLDHWVPAGRMLRKAIERLDTPLSTAELEMQTQCMPGLLAKVDADLSASEAAYAMGDTSRAGELLASADVVRGGLASERLVKLARLLAP